MGIANPIPPGAKVISFTVQWAGQDRNDANNQFDFAVLCEVPVGDGSTESHVFHAWYVPSFGWYGYEDMCHLETKGAHPGDDRHLTAPPPGGTAGPFAGR